MIDSQTIHVDNIFVRELTPKNPNGAFLLLHGMESHSGWFLDCASRLLNANWAVIAFDRPGWGKSPGPRGHLPSYRDFVDYTSSLATQTRKKYGPVHLAGMSWGGMACLYLALRRGWLFDSVSLIAPGLATQRDLPITSKPRLALALLTRHKETTAQPSLTPASFTADPQWQRFIQSDPDRVTAVSAGFCLETLKMRKFIKAAAGRRSIPPALCLLAGNDSVIDNPTTAAIARRAGALVELIPRAAHTLIFEKPAQTAGILDHHAAHASLPSPNDSANTWIIGPGAVGGAVAALLSLGGAKTSALVKPDRLHSMESSGITLHCGPASRTATAITFADSPRNLPHNPSLVILAVKSFDTDSALKQLAGTIPSSTVILSLQNGIGNEERIARAFPRNTVIAASICASLELLRPGHILWADDRGGLAGALHSGNDDIARAAWESALPRTGMECPWLTGENANARLKWSKLMLNIGFNALNSITGMTSAAILADPVFGTLAVKALREGFHTMDAMNLKPVDLPGFPVSKLRTLLKSPDAIARRAMAWQAKRSPEAAFSMRQDILKNRQYTEINELNGIIVQHAARLGIPAPANGKLVEMVEEFSKKNIL